MTTPVVDVGGPGYLTAAHGRRDGAIALLLGLAGVVVYYALNGART